MDDTEAAKARRMRRLMESALTLLLDRAGGSVSWTESEYQAAIAKYGGSSRVNLHIEVVKANGVDVAKISLQEKAPTNAELVS